MSNDYALTGEDWHSDNIPELPKGKRQESVIKASNPKDSIGIKKVSMSVVPAGPLMEAALGMMEGAAKYGRHNYRAIGVRASVYYDATMRHMMDWWEGEDIDAASGLSHITKAITSLIVLRDAMMNDKWVDDRPPPSKTDWQKKLTAKAAEIVEAYPEPVAAYTADYCKDHECGNSIA